MEKAKTTEKQSSKEPKTTICYTGKGANKSGLHTDSEFLSLVKKQDMCKENCPTTIEGWIEWFGAGRKKTSQCKKVVSLNKQISSQYKKSEKANDKLKECIENQCNYAKENVVSSGVCVAKRCEKESKNVSKTSKKLDAISDKASRVWDA